MSEIMESGDYNCEESFSYVQDSEALANKFSSLCFPNESNNRDVSKIIDVKMEDSDEEQEISDLEIERRNNARHNSMESKILKLPLDVLMLIFRWVAADHLDFKSIENLSQVCGYFYVLARDPALWRAACQITWGEKITMQPFPSWRSVYLDRPHVWINGVYISRTSYVRSGDNSSLTKTYRPYFLVEYCRYLRFFPNGKVLMVTTANDPAKIVKKLQSGTKRIAGLLVGKYWIHSETKTKKYRNATLSAMLYPIPPKDNNEFKKKAPPKNPSVCEYNIELEITSTSSNRHFNRLVWLKHSCTTIYTKTGLRDSIMFNVSQQYPPLYYSPVKYYSSYATDHL